ncbi:PPC domain-containing DNA-binding protein [Arenibaculum pallidiluteum]|uniref:PPC domain-containing DNA-binding protein n=1 Tax=Arenibaculum pallidiluteum TaxID=2812559 RepID=UPI001A975AA2|nr:DUF296 domain-containing protein [Arenibaculum pallidiluteum]
MDEGRIKDGSERTYVVAFREGEDPLAGLDALAREKEFTASRLAGTGGFARAILGLYDPELRNWRRIAVDEQVEVVSMTGTVAIDGSGPSPWIKCVLARADGSVIGGHLLEAVVRPVLEVVLTEAPGTLRRDPDPEGGPGRLSLGRFATP